MSKSIEEIDLESIAFSKTKVKTGNKFLYVYSNKKPLILKMPKMRLPFGLNKDTMSNKKQYIMDLSFEDCLDFVGKFEDLNKIIISKVHSEFYPEKTIEEVENMYTNCIKFPNNPSYSPTFRSKIITQDNEKIKCDFYESEKVNNSYPKINIEENGGDDYLMAIMTKGTYLETILECIGLWIVGDKFGLSYKATQVKVYPKKNTVIECEFIDSDDNTSNSEIDFCD